MEKNNYLILDKEFLDYCKLNNIDDIEKMARETFNQGFTILKYGKDFYSRPLVRDKKEADEFMKNLKLASGIPKPDVIPVSQKPRKKLKDLYDE